MIETKTSVSFIELHPAIRWACDLISALWASHGEPRPVITSAGDSTHSATSLHYGRPGDARCRAIDIRTRNLAPHQQTNLTAALQRLLGPCYDVVLESDHIHVELDARAERLEGL